MLIKLKNIFSDTVKLSVVEISLLNLSVANSVCLIHVYTKVSSFLKFFITKYSTFLTNNRQTKILHFID